MRKVEIICDKCGKLLEEHGDYWNIEKEQWCFECIKAQEVEHYLVFALGVNSTYVTDYRKDWEIGDDIFFEICGTIVKVWQAHDAVEPRDKSAYDCLFEFLDTHKGLVETILENGGLI